MNEKIVGLCQPPGMRMIVGLGDGSGWCVVDERLMAGDELKIERREMDDGIINDGGWDWEMRFTKTAIRVWKSVDC